MSWQDELRKLDDELAAGRISADDYRSRRDQILSTAVSPGAQPGAGQDAAAESTTMMPAVQPPPQQQGGANTGGDDADRTQVVSGQDLGDSDRTQAVGGWRATPPEDPNRTQVVPGVPPQAQGSYPPRPAPSPPGGFPQPPPNQPPWGAEEDLAPPWAGQEFPPLAAAGTPDWARQGPEVFETEKKSSTGKVLGIIGIVVVLIGIAAGAYFMFRPDNETADPPPGGGGDDPQQTQSAPPTSEVPEGPIVELPGEQQNMSQIDSFEKVKGIDYLTPQEIGLYEAGGPGEAAVAIANDNGIRVIVLVVTMSDEAAAATARDELGALQLRFSLSEREGPENVLSAANQEASKGPLLRSHYSSGNQVIRLQAQGEDKEGTNALFDEVLASQLEKLPADG
ncbi:hypothetical protein BLA60_32355 [Actinophytocola xinjiangensis]|uniref:Uncharacterized protein n=1 Tax=Actinophytocola xinjiangensis TaxID=485602 RepID=A0A7Z0WFU6_9PSEU|nr:hypothetical protein [Actinophytocola xinjiangensis]OLF06331.1 hypothetical protein BLA60_32355 [Actinophytocola xinjiangensis]